MLLNLLNYVLLLTTNIPYRWLTKIYLILISNLFILFMSMQIVDLIVIIYHGLSLFLVWIQLEMRLLLCDCYGIIGLNLMDMILSDIVRDLWKIEKWRWRIILGLLFSYFCIWYDYIISICYIIYLLT